MICYVTPMCWTCRKVCPEEGGFPIQREVAEKIQRCSRCHIATYCSTACQKNDWREHKLECAAPPAFWGDVKMLFDRLLLTQRIFFTNHPSVVQDVNDKCFQFGIPSYKNRAALFENKSRFIYFACASHERGELPKASKFCQFSGRFKRDLVVSFRCENQTITTVMAVIKEHWQLEVPSSLSLAKDRLYVFQQQWAVSTDRVLATSSPSVCFVVVMLKGHKAALSHIDIGTDASSVLESMLKEFNGENPAVTIIGGHKTNILSKRQGDVIQGCLKEKGITDVNTHDMYTKAAIPKGATREKVLKNKHQHLYGYIEVNPKARTIVFSDEIEAVECIQGRRNALYNIHVVLPDCIPGIPRIGKYPAHKVT